MLGNFAQFESSLCACGIETERLLQAAVGPLPLAQGFEQLTLLSQKHGLLRLEGQGAVQVCQGVLQALGVDAHDTQHHVVLGLVGCQRQERFKHSLGLLPLTLIDQCQAMFE